MWGRAARDTDPGRSAPAVRRRASCGASHKVTASRTVRRLTPLVTRDQAHLVSDLSTILGDSTETFTSAARLAQDLDGIACVGRGRDTYTRRTTSAVHASTPGGTGTRFFLFKESAIFSNESVGSFSSILRILVRQP